MSEEDLRDFHVEIKDVDWYEFGQINAYGTVKYYLGLNCICPVGDLQPVVQMAGIKPGHDMKFISKNYPGMAGKKLSDVFGAVLDPARFQAFVKLFEAPSLSKDQKQE